MALAELRELTVRLWRLRERSEDDLVPVAALQDLLLDARGAVPQTRVAVLDRHLAATAHRSWFTRDEAGPVFRDLGGLLSDLSA